MNEPTFDQNPAYQLILPKGIPYMGEIPVCIMLEQNRMLRDIIPGQIIPYEYYIGFYVFDEGIYLSTFYYYYYY